MVDFINLTGIQYTPFSVIEGIEVIKPLFFYIIGIVIYSIFIFKFYKFLAKRDIVELHLDEYSESFVGFVKKFFELIFYILEYLVLFPLFAFFWFLVMAGLFLFLSKNQDVGTILLMCMSLVTAVRITAYYNEDLSRDLAKMIPFALLGIFLVDVSFFSFSNSINTALQLPMFWKTALYYLGFFIALELVLRLVEMAYSAVFRRV
ncbi:MAG: hypothetical protein ABII01_01545 [Candidatus Woesearchaeota archaeon]